MIGESGNPGSGTSSPLDLLPGMARVAATAAWHTTGWAVGMYLRTGLRVIEAATSPRRAATLVNDARDAAATILRDVIRLADTDERLGGAAVAADMAKRVVDAVPMPPRPEQAADHNGDRGSVNGHAPERRNGTSPRSLREEGEELLRRSRDVHYEFDAHPAYERILSELAPDEARILRLLLLEGPQPSVDIRTGGPLGLVKSRLIAPGLSMIGARAGCRYVDRVPSYLNNLFRLGLVWFSRETLNDPARYQVLEAQPDVLEAIHSVQYAKVVRRSIHLTPFGEDFCRVCLTPERTRLDTLPAHSAPPEHTATPQPPALSED
jgi:hypothetical protein